MARRQGQRYERLLAQEKLILAVTERLLEVMDARRVSRKDIGDRLGKSKAFVSQVLNGSRNMTLRTLADLCWALDCDADVALRQWSGELQCSRVPQSPRIDATQFATIRAPAWESASDHIPPTDPMGPLSRLAASSIEAWAA